MTALSTEQEGTIVGSGPVALPRVNLLPPEIEARRRLRRVQTGVAGAVAGAVLAVGGLFLLSGGSLSDARAQLDAASAEQAALQSEKAGFTDVTAKYAEAAAAQQRLSLAMGQEVRYSRLLNQLSATVPEGVWVTDATYDQTAAGTAAPGAVGSITFTGVAFTHDQVARWLETVNTQQGVRDARLTSSTAALLGTRPVVNWTSTASLTSDALSGRYTAPPGG